jgi:flagellar L-ring protein precursor FlgH
MSYRVIMALAAAVWFASAGQAIAQSSSLYQTNSSRSASAQEGVVFQSSSPPVEDGMWAAGRRVDTVPLSTRIIEHRSLIGVAIERPRPIQPHDLITIIVRESKNYQSNATANNEKKWNVAGDLKQWLKLYPGNQLGRQDFSVHGTPSAVLNWDNKFQGTAQDQRQDAFTTRITGQVVDVKPNGTVVIEARKHEKHDEEELTLTLTGTCRAADISPDNTILSTQVHDLNINEVQTGAVRDTTRRGWIPRLVDFLRPF